MVMCPASAEVMRQSERIKAMKTFYLVLQEGSLQKAVYPLSGTTTIGRSPENTINLLDSGVSRQHVRLGLEDGSWVMEDLGSLNGVMYNDTRVDRSILSAGDIIRIGNTTFRVVERDALEDEDHPRGTIEILSSSTTNQELLDIKGGVEQWANRLFKAIDAIPLFSYLGEDERKRLINGGTCHLFGPGESIIWEGDQGRSVYVILDGRVRVFTRDGEGNKVELAILGPTDFFGEMSFLTARPRTGSVEAVEVSVVMEFNYSSIRMLIEQYSAVGETLAEHYLDRSQDLVERRGQRERP